MSDRRNAHDLSVFADDATTGGPAVYLALRGNVFAQFTPDEARALAAELMTGAHVADHTRYTARGTKYISGRTAP